MNKTAIHFSNRKLIFLCIVSIFLSACTSTNNHFFKGKSATYDGDNILRNDVFAEIKRTERLAYQCHDIQSVNSRIEKVERINERLHVQEYWEIQACEKTPIYEIHMREDANGETDFTVRRLP